MGMYVGIFKDSRLGDCTNNGISSKAKGLCVVNVSGPWDPDSDHPAAMLVDSPFGGAILVPAYWSDEAGAWHPSEQNTVVRCGPMYGGNIADTSDSRWTDAVRQHVARTMRKAGFDTARARIPTMAFSTAVHIHDRYETWEQYEVMSRG